MAEDEDAEIGDISEGEERDEEDILEKQEEDEMIQDEDEMEEQEDEMGEQEDEMVQQEDEMEQQEDEMEQQEDEMEQQEDEMEQQEDEMEEQEDEMVQQENQTEPQEDQMEGEENVGEDLAGPIDETEESPKELQPEVMKVPQSEALQGKIDDNTMKELLQVEKEVKEAANAIYELKIRIEELLKKEKMTAAEEKELEQKNLQLKDLMMLFDEKTLKIQEIIVNTNILESMPVRLPQEKHEEDVLPRVILCGFEEDHVPKMIVCNQKVRSVKGKTHECFSGCPGPSPSYCFTSTKKEPSSNKQEKNEDLDIIKSKLENDITTKDRLLTDLQMKLQCLQNEIHMVATENAQLNDKIRKMQQDQEKKNYRSCQIKEIPPNILAVKLREYGKYTRKLEGQVAEMEEDLMRVRKEICDAMKARDRISKYPKMISPCRKR